MFKTIEKASDYFHNPLALFSHITLKKSINSTELYKILQTIIFCSDNYIYNTCVAMNKHTYTNNSSMISPNTFSQNFLSLVLLHHSLQNTRQTVQNAMNNPTWINRTICFFLIYPREDNRYHHRIYYNYNSCQKFYLSPHH